MEVEEANESNKNSGDGRSCEVVPFRGVSHHGRLFQRSVHPPNPVDKRRKGWREAWSDVVSELMKLTCSYRAGRPFLISLVKYI
jgi:hypothetical protein